MILVKCEQGTREWDMARLGIPTCSRLDEILTPKSLKRSTSAGKYRNQLLAEWLFGAPIDWGGSSEFMQRGTEMEPKARAFYEMQRDVDVTPVGFILRDDRLFGGSPDGLVEEDGGLEIKCPALHTHIGYLTDPKSLVEEYRGQVQGNLALSGRRWWDIMSYNPQLPEVIVRVERDEAYITALDRELKWFTTWLCEGRDILAPYRPEEAGRAFGTVEDLLERSLAEVG